jgi:hypothetical protein
MSKAVSPREGKPVTTLNITNNNKRTCASSKVTGNAKRTTGQHCNFSVHAAAYGFSLAASFAAALSNLSRRL